MNYDIYHSNIIVVGPPDAPFVDDGSANSINKDSYYRLNNGYKNFIDGSSCGGSCANRTEVILAGANNGILHAFDAHEYRSHELVKMCLHQHAK